MQTDDPEFPRVSSELVEALELMFPDRCPDIKTPEREIWMAAGRAEVVRFLKQQSLER